ncbi:hypothetical protein SDC9_129564 [bioreactor metagenome]|uniref:DNA helicase n=1 Tax=bioreactor metagenome TaxID=1076179 RepID=A0A645D078_9ZZZZ
MTIHAAQGLTLEKVQILLGKGTFEHGQLYVALSRCRSYNGLYLDRPIAPRDFHVDDRLAHFQESMELDVVLLLYMLGALTRPFLKRGCNRSWLLLCRDEYLRARLLKQRSPFVGEVTDAMDGDARTVWRLLETPYFPESIKMAYELGKKYMTFFDYGITKMT